MEGVSLEPDQQRIPVDLPGDLSSQRGILKQKRCERRAIEFAPLQDQGGVENRALIVGHIHVYAQVLAR